MEQAAVDKRKRREELERRMLLFAGGALELVLLLPAGPVRDVIGRQLLRSATSVGANYREANRAQSNADFVSKVGIAEKEASETVYWLELCELKCLGAAESVSDLRREANELLAILVTIGRKAKGR